VQTRTYFASSVPAAFQVARKELGEDALFVSSAPAPAEFRQLGRFEVTFGWNPGETPVPGSDRVEKQLVVRGFSRETACEIASAAARRAGSADEAAIDELASRIPVAPSREEAPRTMIFIGPPGRGKTTSLLKIAAVLGLSRGLPVRIFSAGAEQKIRLAGVPGAAWKAYESLAGLNLELNAGLWPGLTLIDTPGISPADRAEYFELSEFLAGRPEISKQLVLRAEATSADMLHMVSRFSGLTPLRLLFTGVDEASSLAPMVETLMRSRIPAAFMGTGQKIPSDLAKVNAERLARSAWAGSALRAEGTRHAFAAA
jgi:flagellar biosynthesis protein FlhF